MKAVISFPLAPPTLVAVSGLEVPPAKNGSQVPFHYRDLDGNTAALAQAINSSSGTVPPSKTGLALGRALDSVRNELDLGKVLGQADREYECSAPLSSPSSLYGLYMDKAVPAVLFDRDQDQRENPQWFVFGTVRGPDHTL